MRDRRARAPRNLSIEPVLSPRDAATLMEPEIRTAVLTVGVLFCVLFLTLTIGVVADSGLDILTVTSFVIIGLLAIGLIGAIRNPPQ
jgi:hypothetical protein